MSGAGSVRAGGAFVEIFAKDSKFQQAMARVQKKLRDVGKAMRSAGTSMMGIGAGIVAPILAAAQSFASFGSELHDMSQRTGIAASELSVLRYAAEQTGTEMGALETGVKKMQQLIFKASQGSDEAAQALAQLGLRVEDLAGLSADQQLGIIGDRLAGIEDPGTRAAVAVAIFGRAGTALLPMLSQGSAGIAAFAEEARRLGLIMDDETAAKADDLGDAIDALKASMRMAFIQVGSAVAPMLTEMARALAAAAKAAGDFIRENAVLVSIALKLGAVLVSVGAVLYGVGTACDVVASSIGILSKALMLIPVLLSPIGAIGVVIAGAVGIATAVARTLSPTFKHETDAIMAAIMSLDFGKAWSIMNVDFAIALTQMAKAVDGAGRYIWDALIGGLDRFMGLFGADIITLQNAWERLGIYFRAAFDWKWAITGMNAALDEADRRAEEARKKAPTAADRSAQRARGREEEAARWDGTIEQLRAERAAFDRPDVKTSPDAAKPGSVSPTMPLDLASESDAAGNKSSRSFGGFGSGAGLGLGAEVDLVTPAKQTAANTAIAAEALQQIAGSGAGLGGGAAAAASGAAAAAVPSAQAGVRTAAAVDVASAIASMRDAVVGAIREHIAATMAGNKSLERIASKIEGGAAAFV